MLPWTRSRSCTSTAREWSEFCDSARPLIHCNAQELSNIAWALVKLAIWKNIPMKLIATSFIKNSESFSSQNIANLAWAFAQIREHETGSLASFWATVVRATCYRISEFQLQELANLCWSFASVKNTSALKLIADEHLARIPASTYTGADPRSLLAMVWALSFAGMKHKLVFQTVRRQLRRYGRDLDRQNEQLRAVCAVCPLPANGGHGGFGGEPGIVLELADVVVLTKPPGWEVERELPSSTNGGWNGKDNVHVLEHLFQLQTFLMFTARAAPIWFDKPHHFGFLHRLDIPGSGLILAARSFEAYYELLYQLNGNMIVRDYVVLCHGWLSQKKTTITAPIHWTPGNPAPSQVRSGGKPSVSCMTVVARFRQEGECFSLLAVRIGTGRTHQIRVA